MSPNVSTVNVHSPIDVFLTNAFGVDRKAISAAVLDAQKAYVSACLNDAGYSLKPTELLDSSGQVKAMEALAGDYFEISAARLSDSLGAIRAPDPVDDSQARTIVFNKCRSDALQSIVSPLASFNQWVFDQEESLRARSGADPLVIEAKRTGRKCISNLGYGVQNVGDLNQLFLDKGLSIVREFDQSTLTEREARQRLQALAQQEESLAPIADACAVRQYQASVDSLARLESGFVDQNGPALKEWIQKIKVELIKLRKYFSVPLRV